MGTTVRRLIELAGGVSGGGTVARCRPGGASSNLIGPDKLDLQTRLRHGRQGRHHARLRRRRRAAEGTDLLAAITNVLRFFRNESCGKCVPAAVGSKKAHEILREVIESGESPEDGAWRDRIVQLERSFARTSICGARPGGAGPVVSVARLSRECPGPEQTEARRRARQPSR